MYGYCDIDIIVGENGYIGYGVILYGCVIGCDVLVGMNSVIMDGVVIGEESIVVVMSFVKVGFSGEKCQLLIGILVCVVCSVSDDELYWKWLNIKEYQDFVGCCYVLLYEMQLLR